jgi:hypothetical protein
MYAMKWNTEIIHARAFDFKASEEETLHSYSISFEYQDRQNGATKNTVAMEGSTIPVVIGKAARAFFKGLDRKQRFDANKGLTISCTREAGAENEGKTEA